MNIKKFCLVTISTIVLILIGTNDVFSQWLSRWIKVGQAGINSHSSGGPAWCPQGSFITQIDLDAAHRASAHGSPIVGQVSCSRLTGAEYNGWSSSRWIKIEKAGINSHSSGGRPWCPQGSFITQIDQDSDARASAHDSPVIGQVKCASLAGYSRRRWRSTTGWLEIGPRMSHNPGSSWCPQGSFITQIDLDAATRASAHDSPVIGRVKCSFPKR